MTLDKEFQTASRESLLFLTKAFRGGVDLEDRSNRALLSAASTTLGSWTRMQQTTSAREATRFAMALALQRDHDGMTVSEAMALTMPDNTAIKALSAGDERAA